GNDVIDGGAGTDMAVYAGPKASYTITPFGGHVLVSGPEGSDKLTGVELLQFNDAYQMVSNTADISQVDPFHIFTFPLPNSNPIYGTDGGDFLTVATNVNGHSIDLGDGLDNLFLFEPGDPVNFFLDLHNVEQVFDLGGHPTVTMVSALNGTLINLGLG